MSRSSEVRKFSCRVLHFRYIFLIIISRQNKLVYAPRASKKITRFIPLRVHLLEIRRLGSWNTLPRRKSGISYFPHDKCLYLKGECRAYRWILLNAASCGFTSERRVPDFIALFAFTRVGECKVKVPTTVR